MKKTMTRAQYNNHQARMRMIRARGELPAPVGDPRPEHEPRHLEGARDQPRAAPPEPESSGSQEDIFDDDSLDITDLLVPYERKRAERADRERGIALGLGSTGRQAAANAGTLIAHPHMRIYRGVLRFQGDVSAYSVARLCVGNVSLLLGNERVPMSALEGMPIGQPIEAMHAIQLSWVTERHADPVSACIIGRTH